MTNSNLFDIVVFLGPNDVKLISKQIEYTKKNIVGYRNLYIVSYDSSFHIDNCITIDENIYPFSKKDVEQELGKESRQNWYLQQLLKLYSGFVIPDILDSYLVIDSDIFFLKPTTFIDDGIYLFDHAVEYNFHYFDHMNRLLPKLIRVDRGKSGITHHMIFYTKFLQTLFNEVETLHKIPFWKAFLKCITGPNLSGASEYEIYFNYMLITYPDKIRLRSLSSEDVCDITKIDFYECDFISCHHYNRILTSIEHNYENDQNFIQKENSCMNLYP
jgi:hypothetical protein